MEATQESTVMNDELFEMKKTALRILIGPSPRKNVAVKNIWDDLLINQNEEGEQEDAEREQDAAEEGADQLVGALCSLEAATSRHNDITLDDAVEAVRKICKQLPNPKSPVILKDCSVRVRHWTIDDIIKYRLKLKDLTRHGVKMMVAKQRKVIEKELKGAFTY